MTRLQATALLGCLFGFVAGCSKDAEVLSCNPGTLLLHITCEADLGDVNGEVALEGLAEQMATKPFTLTCPANYNLQVNVSGYQTGGKIKARVSGTAGQAMLGSDLAESVTLVEGCTKVDVKLERSTSNNPDAPTVVPDSDGGTVPPTDGPVTQQPDADPTATGLSRGDRCERNDQCTDGICADGVCCDKACDGVCMACTMEKTGSPDGQCTFAKTGAKHSKCETKEAKNCGTNGTCNGAGQCAFWDNTNECVAATCTAGDYVPAQKCNGAGACQTASPSKCGEYACTPQGCKTTCAGNSDCSAGVQCINSKCGGKRALGEACNANSECTSPGFCTDGVCCGSKCDGTCEACNATITGGNNGECMPVPASKGPQAECAVQAASSCGTTGRCDGARQCEKHAAGTECAGAMCSATTQTSARKCDGAGECLPAMTTDCVPGKCDATTKQCKLSCTGDGDCATGAYCDSNTCKTKKAAAATCGRAGECSSNFCADGKCCNQACNGSCLECSTGTCKPVTNAEDPGSCSGTKSCSPGGSCLLKNGQACGNGTECISGQCTTFYRDQDGDGQGAKVGEGFCGTTAPSGYLTSSDDCCDLDKDAYKVLSYLYPLTKTEPNKCGSWDWDCSGDVWNKTGPIECFEDVVNSRFDCRDCAVRSCSTIQRNCYDTAGITVKGSSTAVLGCGAAFEYYFCGLSQPGEWSTATVVCQ